MKMLTCQSQPTINNIVYNVFTRSNVANYISNVSSKPDALIDVLKNRTILLPSTLELPITDESTAE